MTINEWNEIRIAYRRATGFFNLLKWDRCRRQLLDMGCPEDAVAFIMSPVTGNASFYKNL
jgi:hypothetical protein